MKIFFLSANKFGFELLSHIVNNKLFNIDLLITLNEGSSTKMYDGIPIKKWDSLGIKIKKINRIEKEGTFLENENPDLVITVGWRQIIAQNILDTAKIGFIGFHPTLLPKGRGSAPIINSILNKFTNSGLTLFKFDKGVDSGDIIFQRKFNINKDDHALDIYQKIIKLGISIINNLSDQIKSGNILFHKQDKSQSTTFKQLSLIDNEICRFDKIDEIYIKIRAFSHPYNGAFITIGNIKLIIFKAKIINMKKIEIKEGVFQGNNINKLYGNLYTIDLIKYTIDKGKIFISKGYLNIK